MNIQTEFFERLAKDSIISSIKDPKSLDQFLEKDIGCAFLLLGNINVIKTYVDLLKTHGRHVFLHIEKIPGISYDKEGLRFINHYVKPTGIVTTKSSLIQLAKKEGLIAIQRLFLIDSDALKQGLKNAEEVQPDALELMPGIIPDMIRKVSRETAIPLITGGLVQNKSQMVAALESGAYAVSTGKPWLWEPVESRVREELKQ
ncbi:glycerol-3-phosphate responsive antiterminator [Jeotgalibacillus soli]|uniref:Glycerol uptake operon antiterminator regulatory protein n=1 Tax=Jeotgalibacillus soli TaxID=889306 RepID=A0A0C2R4D4_9BACL|nr:glycerol-3-phosphate responsive antiterminator [Jeotgalibacillus soli]KIL45095.1 glycerol uptake operon antiterminator regulatory protein [Jeotgalibacillus soli]